MWSQNTWPRPQFPAIRAKPPLQPPLQPPQMNQKNQELRNEEYMLRLLAAVKLTPSPVQEAQVAKEKAKDERRSTDTDQKDTKRAAEIAVLNDKLRLMAKKLREVRFTPLWSFVLLNDFCRLPRTAIVCMQQWLTS